MFEHHAVTPASCFLYTDLLVVGSMRERLIYTTLDWRVGPAAAAAAAA